jgi:hypothetical protein
LRQYRKAILLEVPPFKVPVEAALAVIEDNAASSMLVTVRKRDWVPEVLLDALEEQYRRSSEKIVARSSRL